MTWTTEDLTALDAAIKGGHLSVSHGGRTVTYRSLDDMLRVRNLIRSELGLVGGDSGRTHRYGTHSKGLE